MKIQRYGWIPQHPDKRDAFYRVTAPAVVPPSVDLRPIDVPIYDQKELGSCTANGICGAYLFDRKRQGLDPIEVSRLYLYYNERVIEGSVATDAGANIRDGFKTLNTQGVCHESLWPYDVSKFAQEPPPEAFADGPSQESVVYRAVPQDLNAIKGVLFAKACVVFGFTVYDSFESQEVASTGVAPMPDDNENVLGGHCVRAVGYDDSLSAIICANSWGTGWGKAGYFTLPYDYVASPDLASDFWAVDVVK